MAVEWNSNPERDYHWVDAHYPASIRPGPILGSYVIDIYPGQVYESLEGAKVALLMILSAKGKL